jgi:transposase
MTLEAEVARLRDENQTLTQQVAGLAEQLKAAQQRIAELEQRRPDPPAFVKANRPNATQPKAARKKRDRHHNHNRTRATPTRVVQHVFERCPDCNYGLQGSTVVHRREVIELPDPQPVEVIEHQVIKRFCPHCECYKQPALDLHGQVLGHGRIGVRVITLIAYLHTTLRLPIRRIVAYLATVHNLKLAAGTIVELLHQLRRTLEDAIDDLKTQARASPVLHADETGWREDGQNGYIWCFTTPGDTTVRYYEYDHSRSQAVLKRVLGGQFDGCLVSDFYGGYNIYAGKHQRCWVHLLRDLHALKEQHAADAVVKAWAQDVRALYDAAQAWLHDHPQPQQEAREQQYVTLVTQAHTLGLAYARVGKHPCQALAKRLLRHEDELFQFVLIDGMCADNNLAERSIRPLVVVRKISGGSRSEEGTKTRMGLASLFETWLARKLNPFAECLRLLTQAASPTESLSPQQ